jgi:hypothetical protein
VHPTEAEEKQKAEEAEVKFQVEEAKEAENRHKAKEAKEAERKRKAEEDWVAKEAAKKKKAKAERVEKARTAQATYEAGIWVIQANQRNLAEQTAQINAQALATKRGNLGKLGVDPNDLLLQTPVGPGPSNTKVRKIHKGLVHQLKKRKLGDNNNSVVLADAAEYATGVAVSFHFTCFRFG